jgi:hypothetical protein
VGSSANEFEYTLKSNTKKDNYDIRKTEGTLTVTDENVPDKLVVTKDDGSDESYVVGDTIEWTVTVTNIYDEEKTLTVTEAEGMTIVGEVPATLTAGQEIEIKVQHVVTKEDVTSESGKVKNTVTVKIGDLEKTGEDEVPTEKIEIEITAASDKKVYDATPLTNDGWTQTKGKLAEGHEISEVTVTGEQLLVGENANVASDAKIVDAKGADMTDCYKITYIDGTLTVTDGKGPDEEPVPDELVVTKDDGSDESYQLGDTIEWTVTVKNIYDEDKTLTVTEAEGMTIVGTVPATLTAGQEIEIKVQHVVTDEDVTNGKVKNTVTVKIGDLEKTGEDEVPVLQKVRLTVNYWFDQVGGEKAADTFTAEYLSGSQYNVASPAITGYIADQERVTGTIKEDTTLDVIYTIGEYVLRINYVYEDGSEAAPTYRATLAYGANYAVYSPVIEGYTTNLRLVSGTMPAQHVTYTLVYRTAYEIIDDYDTPLGLAGLGMCTGECYE